MTGGGVLAAVLAGGRSRRYGAEKSAARVAGVPMVRRVLDVAARVADEVVLVSSRPVAGAEGEPRIPDRVEGKGPLGGLHAALHAARERGRGAVLLLACDLPLLSGELLEALLRARGDAVALAPARDDGSAQVLCAVWDVVTLEATEARLAAADLSLQSLFRQVGGRVVEPSALAGAHEDALLNVNRPEERERAHRVAVDREGGAGG